MGIVMMVKGTHTYIIKSPERRSQTAIKIATRHLSWRPYHHPFHQTAQSQLTIFRQQPVTVNGHPSIPAQIRVRQAMPRTATLEGVYHGDDAGRYGKRSYIRGDVALQGMT